MAIYREYTVRFYGSEDSEDTIEFKASFINKLDIRGAKLILAAASSLYNPTNKFTVVSSNAITSTTKLSQHISKEFVLKMLEDITDEFYKLICNLPYGLYEYKGIRIVNSNQPYHKCTDKDVIDMNLVAPTDMIKVKYAAALVHAFIILQTEEKLPDWLEEELEVHRAVNILEG